MARPKEGNYKPMTVNLDPAETEQFTELLPKGIGLSAILREFIHDEKVRLEKEKKGIAPAKGAINSLYNKANKYYVDGQKQATLDLYKMEKTAITEHLIGIKDPKTLIKLRNMGHQIKTLAQTRLKKL
jgi:hypothetical protein